MNKLFVVLICLVGSSCASTMIVRGSSSDFLQKKGTSVTVNAPPNAVNAELDRLFMERGFMRVGDGTPATTGGEVLFYKGPRHVSTVDQDYGIQLGSWFAARVLPQGNQTTLSILGKPMIGQVELCSDNDSDLTDIKYVCTDTQVPKNYMALNMITGRDEETVVSDVLDRLYERLK